jgi:hypothetical protein
MALVSDNFTANHQTIEQAINLAPAHGADWFITPEIAESGYEFTDYLQPGTAGVPFSLVRFA